MIAINPYDYGRWGGIRRSSPLANLLFTMMLLPGVGAMVLGVGAKGARSVTLEECGHFASLEQPEWIARVIREEVSQLRAT